MQRSVIIEPLSRIEQPLACDREPLSLLLGRARRRRVCPRREGLAARTIIGPENHPHDPVALRILQAVSRDSVRPKGGAREPAVLAGVERHGSGIPTQPTDGNLISAPCARSDSGRHLAAPDAGERGRSSREADAASAPNQAWCVFSMLTSLRR